MEKGLSMNHFRYRTKHGPSKAAEGQKLFAEVLVDLLLSPLAGP